MFVSKKDLRIKISVLERDNNDLGLKNDRLERSNKDLSRRVEDLQNSIKELTLLYSDIPELEKAMSIECKTCKYACKSNDYFNYGEVIGCKRNCVCSFYEREEEDDDDDD